MRGSSLASANRINALWPSGGIFIHQPLGKPDNPPSRRRTCWIVPCVRYYQSFVKPPTTAAASIGNKVRQFQNSIDEVPLHGTPNVVAPAPRTSGLFRVRRYSGGECLQTRRSRNHSMFLGGNCFLALGLSIRGNRFVPQIFLLRFFDRCAASAHACAPPFLLWIDPFVSCADPTNDDPVLHAQYCAVYRHAIQSEHSQTAPIRGL
jgi:hypothetical protein